MTAVDNFISLQHLGPAQGYPRHLADRASDPRLGAAAFFIECRFTAE